jgi:hypothetical protein
LAFIVAAGENNPALFFNPSDPLPDMQNHLSQHSERGLIAAIDHGTADMNSAVLSLALFLHSFRCAPFEDFCPANFFMEIHRYEDSS